MLVAWLLRSDEAFPRRSLRAIVSRGDQGRHVVAIVFASEVFATQAVVRAAHRHTATCTVDVQPVPEGVRVVLVPTSASMDETLLAAQLRNDVLDEQVRVRVRGQTDVLHAVLVEAALRGARPDREPSP